MLRWLLIGIALLTPGVTWASDAQPWIGYSRLSTNLPGGRHANIRTQRAMLVRADGSDRRLIGEELADQPDTWTQFAGWSPDGDLAIIIRGWQDPENARWEEEHKTFRMQPGTWLLDTYFIDPAGGTPVNVTGVERVSDYNSGLFFIPDSNRLGFTALIDGISRPYVMDRDGRNKQDVSGDTGGFAYGYSASPDGKSISYHENYQIYIAAADGRNKRHIETGQPFNFVPRWSPDGQWLLFVSGQHYNCHPYLVRADGTRLHKLADRNGYRGVIAFLDVDDFHGGSSDVPVWSVDGNSVFYTALVDDSVELMNVSLDGQVTQLTHSPPGTLHYHPAPSPDGRRLLYGSKRDGVRQLFVRNLDDGSEVQITSLEPGYAAMWPHWQPEGSEHD